MKNLKVVFASLFLTIPLIASAYVIGDSNLGPMGYPEFNEYPPSAPYSKTENSFQDYRYEVVNYVRKAKEFAEACDNDARRANEAAEEAIRKANRAVEEFNSWANY